METDKKVIGKWFIFLLAGCYLEQVMSLFTGIDSSHAIKYRKENTVRKRLFIFLLLSLLVQGIMAGCKKGSGKTVQTSEQAIQDQKSMTVEEIQTMERRDGDAIPITPTSEIRQLETGLSIVRYEGEYGFDGFLDQGGAKSDADAAAYLISLLHRKSMLPYMRRWTA